MAKTYLVTGASRGIGAALVNEISRRQPEARIVASVRDVTSPAAQHLSQQANVVVVHMDAIDDQSPFRASGSSQEQGIDTIDVLYACHGAAPDMEPLDTLGPETVRQSIQINAVSLLPLFQAFKPLLQHSSAPTLVVVASASGSLTLQSPQTQKDPTSAYCISKAALHMLVRRIYVENHDWLSTIALRPGRVATNLTEKQFGKAEVQRQLDEGKAILPSQSAALIVPFVEASTKESHSGRFFDANGAKELPW